MDRMRESVFAVLGDLSGLSFLDMFSGSGIIALEAASRGADPVEAVERDPLKRKTLLTNVSISPVRINCRFMTAEIYVKRTKKCFEVIFCDPPFPYQFKWDLLQAVAASPLAREGSRLLLHRPREDVHEEAMADLVKNDSRQYGRSVVDFFVCLKKRHSP
jgi:16S rRNA (guanine(966)-N(2))-methyltransferase RsmD